MCGSKSARGRRSYRWSGALAAINQSLPELAFTNISQDVINLSSPDKWFVNFVVHIDEFVDGEDQIHDAGVHPAAKLPVGALAVTPLKRLGCTGLLRTYALKMEAAVSPDGEECSARFDGPDDGLRNLWIPLGQQQ